MNCGCDRLELVVIADDLTGAADAGGAFLARGLRTTVLLIDAVRKAAPLPYADVLVLDTLSRADSARLAYAKVRSAATLALALGARRIYKKICSGFRGNIGPELDALLDATGDRCVALVAAFPKAGRATRNGYHYVHGELLEQTALSRDPRWPMRESHLPTILARQTDRPIHLISLAEVRESAASLRRAFEERKREGGIVLIDAETQDDLRRIAALLRRERAIAGAAGLGEELAAFLRRGGTRLGLDRATTREDFSPECDFPVLIIAGSVHEMTMRQNARARESGMPLVAPEVRKVLGSSHTRTLHLRGCAEKIRSHLRRHGSCLLAMAEADSLTWREGKKISIFLGELVREVERSGREAEKGTPLLAPGLVLVGGDTAESVARALGIFGIRLLEQLEPGISAGVALPGEARVLVLKPGSFGATDFHTQAVEHVRRLASMILKNELPAARSSAENA